MYISFGDGVAAIAIISIFFLIIDAIERWR